MRLFLSGLRKLARRPATWVTFGLLNVLIVVIVLAVGATINSGVGTGPSGVARTAAMKDLVTFPGAYDRMLDVVTRFGGLLALVYGAAIAGSEWGWGTFKSAVARGESRIGYILASYTSIGLMVGIGLVVSFAVAIVAAVVGANMAGVSTAGLNDSATLGQVPQLLLKGWFAMLEETALGFAIATLARSQLAGIGVGIAFYFGESFAALLLPDVVQYMPFAAANAAVNTGSSAALGGASLTAALPADQALVLVGVWLVGSLVVAALFSNTAEITG
jgi:hypothetical protein